MFHKFFRDGSSKIVDLRDTYLNESLFIIAGSPAAKKEQLNLLYEPGIVTMAINNAATMVRPNMWVGGDRPECYSPSILTDISITKFSPYGKHEMEFLGEPWKLKPSTFFFNCGDKGYTLDNLFSKHNHIVWWKNTWWIALSLAYTLGFRTLYLVGAEFNIDKDHQYLLNKIKEHKMFDENKSIQLINSCIDIWKPDYREAKWCYLEGRIGLDD